MRTRTSTRIRSRGPSSRELHPGWLSAGRSGDRWVAQIGDKLYPTQEGRGRGVPIESAISPACKAGAADLDQRLADMDAEGIDVQVLFGGLIIGLTSYDDAGFALDVARAYNDWLLDEGVRPQPRAVEGASPTVPLQDVDRSVTEAERAARARRGGGHDPAGGRRREPRRPVVAAVLRSVRVARPRRRRAQRARA